MLAEDISNIFPQTLAYAAREKSYQRSVHHQSPLLVTLGIKGSKWRAFDAACQTKILLFISSFFYLFCSNIAEIDS